MNVKRSKVAQQAMPAVIAPMLATLSGRVPVDQAKYGFEYKWDGVRAIWRWDGREGTLWSRNQLPITARYPELWTMGEVFGSRQAILDGEVIALDQEQRPSFSQLQRRMHVNDPRAVARLVNEVPIFYMIFDVLWLDGRSLMDAIWMERRDRLEELALEREGAAWQKSPAYVGEGTALLQSARKLKLEGIVAKHVEGIYRPGMRSPDWLKIKIVSEQEFVVGGWIPEAGNRTARVGSLLLGYYDERGKLHYAGGVGTGFNEEDHRRLTGRLKGLAKNQSPFVERVPKSAAMYVKPEMVVQVEYRRKGEAGIVQQAAFKGVRADKQARDVEREWKG